MLVLLDYKHRTFRMTCRLIIPFIFENITREKKEKKKRNKSNFAQVPHILFLACVLRTGQSVPGLRTGNPT